MLPEALFLNIHMYGIMVAVGVLSAFGVLFLYGKKLGTDPKFLDFLFYNTFAAIVVGFGTAVLFQSFYDYLKNPAAGFSINRGMTFIGGLIGGAACFLLVYAVLRKNLTGKLSQVISMLPCAITIAHAFGRLGCFFAGCCYGKETSCFLGVQFPNLPAPVHPTQLYESAFLFILFAVLSYLLLKKKFDRNMEVYLISYGIFRFLLEFVRGDNRGSFIGSISPSQFWSIMMVLLGIALLIFVKINNDKPEEPAEETSEETLEEK